MTTRLPYLVCLFALLLVPLAAGAQPTEAQPTGTVTGTVTERESNDALHGVNVVVVNGSRGTATRADGSFSLALPAGPHTLAARFVGYATERRSLSVPAGDTVRVDFALMPAPIGLSGVQVTALRPDLQPSGELSGTRLRELESADTGTLMRHVPGVNAARRGPIGLDPNVRGLSETEIGVFVNGARTFSAGPLRMDSPLSHIDPSAVASVDVVKGPYALTWGGGTMGAVRVTRRGQNPPPGPAHGSVHTGFDTNRNAAETTGLLMGRAGRWDYAVNGAWRRGTDYDAGDGRSIEGDYHAAEGRGRLGVQLSDRSHLDVSGGYQDQSDVDYPGRLLNANYFKTGTGQLHYTYTALRGVLRGIDARASVQQTLHSMTNRGKPTYEAGQFPNGRMRPPLRVSVDTDVQVYSTRLAADLVPVAGWTLKAGTDVLHTYRSAQRPLRVVMNGMERVPPFYDSDEVWPGVTLTQGGVFANARTTLGRVDVSATGRLDRAWADAERPSDTFLQNANATEADLAQTETTVSGALTASVPVSAQWSLSAGVGSVTRPADALERYSDRIPSSKSQTTAEFQGNPFLDPERSTQADLWIDGAGTRWTVRLSGFARRIDNYVTLAPSNVDPLLPLSPPTVFRYVNGEATFYGAEASASWRPVDAVTGRVSGSWLWGRDETQDEPALGVSPPSVDLAVRWQPDVRPSFFRSPYVEGVAGFTAEQDRVATSRGETATDGYTTVDLRAGVRMARRVQVAVAVENLFDATYVNHLNAANPFTGVPLPEPGRVLSLDVTVGF